MVIDYINAVQSAKLSLNCVGVEDGMFVHFENGVDGDEIERISVSSCRKSYVDT